MPIVTIQVTREGTKPGTNSVTPEEKAALIKGASQLLLDVLNKPLEVAAEDYAASQDSFDLVQGAGDAGLRRQPGHDTAGTGHAMHL